MTAVALYPLRIGHSPIKQPARISIKDPSTKGTTDENQSTRKVPHSQWIKHVMPNPPLIFSDKAIEFGAWHRLNRFESFAKDPGPGRSFQRRTTVFNRHHRTLSQAKYGRIIFFEELSDSFFASFAFVH